VRVVSVYVVLGNYKRKTNREVSTSFLEGEHGIFKPEKPLLLLLGV
jgi:hypothetical protein